MAEDRRLTISTSTRFHPDEVARHTFATARRGFDATEVRAYLEQVANEMQAMVDREEEWRRAIDAAEHRAANPVLDEATLTAALGQETARVLRSAHDAATELLAKAEADAARLRAQVEEEASQTQSRSEHNAADRVAQAEAVAADLRRRAEEEMRTRLDASQLEAEELLSQARAECRAMVQEAQEVRTRVLADLVRRRRVLHSQIEQLRAGRERLAETINDVRHTGDRVTDALFRAEDEARLAAEAAGRQAAAQEVPDELDRAASTTDDVGSSPTEAGDGPRPETVTGAGSAPEDEATRQQAVEDLFARLRAERERTGDSESGRSTGAPSPAAGSSAVASPAGPAQESAATTPAGPAATEPPPAIPVETGETELDPRLAARQDLLAPVVTTLVRRLKRALQDDQNDILHRVRAGGGWGPGVLPSPEEHESRYASAVVDHLRDAARSGATFVGGKPDDAPAVDAIAAELASAIVVPLRRRLDGAGASVHAGDDAALVEHVGAAFRDWKGGRVERLAGDEALAAFSQATLAAAPRTISLQWIVDDGGQQCPDCDDNALAGPLARGESFPTGHACPPAHAGCRCLLAPAEA